MGGHEEDATRKTGPGEVFLGERRYRRQPTCIEHAPFKILQLKNMQSKTVSTQVLLGYALEQWHLTFHSQFIHSTTWHRLFSHHRTHHISHHRSHTLYHLTPHSTSYFIALHTPQHRKPHILHSSISKDHLSPRQSTAVSARLSPLPPGRCVALPDAPVL